MRFSCESCKAQLQIADEKLRGKRVTVRCRRCGAKIALADPLLANSSPQLIERPPSYGPMRVSPRSEPARQQADDESTRAMDRDVLERALEASKRGDGAQNGVPAEKRQQFPPPVGPAADVEWYAMIRGRQAGPLTRDELIARAHDGEVGPRTYLWRDGMDAWQRAADLQEMSGMFPPIAQAPTRPSPPTPPAPPAAAQARPVPSPVPPVSGTPPEPAVETARPLEVARWMASEPSPQGAPAQAGPSAPMHYRISRTRPDRGSPMFESTAPSERGPFTVFLGLLALAAAAIVLWIVLAGAPTKRDEPRSEQRTEAPPPPAPSAIPPAAQPQAEPKPPEPPPPESKDPGPPAAAPVPPGLTAEQVHRKLDENKPALQGCVDDALKRDSSLRVGKIHVTTTIAPSGQVTAARIDQKLVDESPLGLCLKRATRKILFPQFTGSAFDVDIPIVVTAESP